MNRWDRASRRLNKRLDAFCGANVTILPQRTGKLTAGGPDPDRPPLSLIGSRQDTDERNVNEGGIEHNFTSSLTGGPMFVSFDQEQFPAGQAQWPRQNDLVRFDDETGSPVFQVTTVDLDDGGRVNAQLTKWK